MMETLKNIKEALGNRIKGVYGGSFIIIWSIYNWELIFSLFNFDSDCTLNEKIILIENIITNSTSKNLFWAPVGFTLVSILLYSLLNSLSYTITSFFKLQVKPRILGFIFKKGVVDREEYNIIEKQLYEVSNEYEKEKTKFNKSKEVIDTLVKEKNTLSINHETKIKGKEEEIVNNYEGKITHLKKNSVSKKIIPITEVFSGSETWEKTSIDFNNKTTTTKLTIINRVLTIHQERVNNRGVLTIEKAHFDITQISNIDNKLFEVLIIKRGGGDNIINKLLKMDNGLLIGTENDNTQVTYKNIPDF